MDFKHFLLELILINLHVATSRHRSNTESSPDLSMLVKLGSSFWENRGDTLDITKEDLAAIGIDAELISGFLWDTAGTSMKTQDPERCAMCTAFVGTIFGFIEANLTFDDIRNFSVQVCNNVVTLNGYDGDVMCDGVVDIQGPHVYYVLNTTDMNTREVCEFHGLCDERNPKASDYAQQRKSPAATSKRKRLKLEGKRPKKEDMIRIAHFSDVHFDEKYTPGSATDTNVRGGCREYWEGTGEAGKWGDYECNIPPWTVEVIFQFLAEQKPHFVMNTGDSPPSVVWEETQAGQIAYSRWIAEAIERIMPGTPAYTTIGNHEIYPTNLYYGQRPQVQALNRNFTEMYANLSNWTTEAIETMETGGYYCMDMLPGLKIMAINGNYGYKNNLYGVLLPDSPDWIAHRDYIENAFKQAQQNCDKILILQHQGVLHYEGFKFFRDWMNRMFDLYGDTILFQLQGHLHRDMLYTSSDENLNATSSIFVGSVSGTASHRNPSVRIMYLHPDTYLPMEWDQYYLNISATQDGVRPQVEFMYNTREAYGMEDLSLDSLEDFIERLLVDDELYYMYEWNKRSRGPGSEPDECTGQCRIENYCDMKCTSPECYQLCLDQF